MSGNHYTLTQKRLREVLKYCPATGLFSWLVDASSRARRGDVAGCAKGGGYVYITVDGVSYRAHRLAHFYIRGSWPCGDVDHKNGIKADNRLENIRIGSRSQNMQNEKKARRSNKSSGLLGAYWHAGAGRWMAQIVTNGKSKYIGLFDTADDAHAAYLKEKRRRHEFCMI